MSAALKVVSCCTSKAAIQAARSPVGIGASRVPFPALQVFSDVGVYRARLKSISVLATTMVSAAGTEERDCSIVPIQIRAVDVIHPLMTFSDAFQTSRQS